MSNVSTPYDSPVHVEPLHNPAHAAQVVVPQAPLGNATNGKVINQMPGMGAKALLAKKMAKGSNPKFISPTDNLMTPCSQKITAAKKKRFEKGAKPMQQFPIQTSTLEEDSDSAEENLVTANVPTDSKLVADEVVVGEPDAKVVDVKMDDPENPF